MYWKICIEWSGTFGLVWHKWIHFSLRFKQKTIFTFSFPVTLTSHLLPQLLLSSAMFPPNLKFLRLSCFEKIGGTGPTDGVQWLMRLPMDGHITTQLDYRDKVWVGHTAGNVLCNGSQVLSTTRPATGFCGIVKDEYRATAPPWEKPPTTIRLRSIPFFSSSAISDCTVTIHITCTHPLTARLQSDLKYSVIL